MVYPASKPARLYPGQVNSPQTTLAAAIDADDTTINVTDATVLPPSGSTPNILVLGEGSDAEAILFPTVPSGNSFAGVTRGFQGTAKSWGIGTAVSRLHTAYDWDSIRQNFEDLTVISGTCGANLQAYQICYLNPTTNTWFVAASSTNTAGFRGYLLAMAVESKLTGQTIKLCLRGQVQATTALWQYYVGKMVYLVSAGGVSDTAFPGRRIPVGYVLTSDTILFDPTGAIGEPVGVSTVDAAGFIVSVDSDTQDTPSSLSVLNYSIGSYNLLNQIYVCGHFNSHQGTTWTALVNSGTGLAPDATSLPFDGESGSVAVGDFIKIDNEIMRVSSINSGVSPFTVVRGVKGTLAQYHDDNAAIAKTHGIRVEILRYAAYSGYAVVWSKSGIRAFSSTLRESISQGAYLAKLNADPSLSEIEQVYIGDYLYTADRLLGDQVNNDYDNCIYTSDPINAANSGTVVYGVDVSNLAAITYGFTTTEPPSILVRVNIDEKIAADTDVGVGFQFTRICL